MPRANRHFLPGHVWHITHRCHRKSFLLKFARDRHNYLRWVFEAKKRFGSSVLNYIVTCNHVHLLVRDTGANVIADKRGKHPTLEWKCLTYDNLARSDPTPPESFRAGSFSERDVRDQYAQ